MPRIWCRRRSPGHTPPSTSSSQEPTRGRGCTASSPNTFISTYRKSHREPQRAAADDIEDWQLVRAGSHTSPGLKSAETEALQWLPDPRIKRALQELSAGFRVAVYLADVEGFAYKEIADLTGTPIGTVMSRLHRAAVSSAPSSKT